MRLEGIEKGNGLGCLLVLLSYFKVQCRRMCLRGTTLVLLIHVSGCDIHAGGLGPDLNSIDQAAVISNRVDLIPRAMAKS